MPRRTMTVTRIWAHPFRDPKTMVDLTDLPGGLDLLHIFHGFALDIAASDLKKPTTESFADVIEVQPKGRTVTVAVDVGRYGAEGKVKNVETNEKRSDFSADDAPMLTTHGMMALPLGSTSALLFVERSANQSGVSRLLELLERKFDTAFPDLRMETETVAESEAWLEAAELTRISAVRFRKSSDKATNIAAPPGAVPGIALGDVAHTLQPKRGNRSLPKYLLDELTSGTVKPGELLGFDDGDGNDTKTEVTLTKGGQRKSFQIGHEKQPPVSYLLTDHGERVFTLDKVRKYALDRASTLFERLNIEWREPFAIGVWSDDDKAVRLVNQRE